VVLCPGAIDKCEIHSVSCEGIEVSKDLIVEEFHRRYSTTCRNSLVIVVRWSHFSHFVEHILSDHDGGKRRREGEGDLV
jgi:hypothetical protein